MDNGCLGRSVHTLKHINEKKDAAADLENMDTCSGCFEQGHVSMAP
jgi:hypothetical protein